MNVEALESDSETDRDEEVSEVPVISNSARKRSRTVSSSFEDAELAVWASKSTPAAVSDIPHRPLISKSEKLQAIKRKKVFNHEASSTNSVVRRAARRLTETVNHAKNREEFESPDSDALTNSLRFLEHIHVNHATEVPTAVTTTHTMSAIAEKALVQTEVTSRVQLPSITDYVKAIRQHYFESTGEEENTEWRRIGSAANRFVRGVTTTGFMLGALELEAKGASESRRGPREEKTELAPVVEPHLIVDREGKDDKPHHSVELLHEYMKASSTQSLPLPELMRCPQLARKRQEETLPGNQPSFSIAVERLFDVGFLLKMNKAAMRLERSSDGSAVPVVEPHDEPGPEQDVQTQNAIFQFDFAAFQEVVSRSNSSSASSPSSRPRPAATPSKPSRR